MFRASSSTRRAEAGVGRLLDSLPSNFATRSVVGGRLVVGPTGAFLVAHAVGDPPVAPTDLGRLAAYYRSVLAERLRTAPFVDALVVVPERWRDQTVAGASAVTIGLLSDTICSGPSLLSEVEIADIVTVLDTIPTA